MMENGDVLAKDFLPAFSNLLEEKFAGAIPNAIQSTTARMTDMKNQGLLLKVELFDALEPTIKTVISGFTGIIKILRESSDAFRAIGVALGVAAGAMIAYNGYLLAMSVSAGIATFATFAQMVATDGLALALYAAGVTGATACILMTGGIALLAGAIYYAWEKSETFRNAIRLLKDDVMIAAYALKYLWDSATLQSGAATADLKEYNRLLNERKDIISGKYKEKSTTTTMGAGSTAVSGQTTPTANANVPRATKSIRIGASKA